MEDTELLEALDRRAAGAVAALDRRLEQVAPAPLPTAPHRHRRGRLAPAVAAAAAAVVGLLGIGLALAGGESTIADGGEVPVETDDVEGITRLALPDPAALGYEVRAAFDGSTIEPSPGMEGIDVRFSAHGPAGDDDPWAMSVISTTTPFDEFTFRGELVDVGGPEAVHLPTGPADRVLWRDGDRARMLLSSRVRGEDLVRVAADAVAAGWTGDGPLPGHEVLHVGTPDEFQPGLEYAGFGPTGWQGIAYDADGTARDFLIAWRAGTDDALQALHALDPDPDALEVDGRDVLVTDAGSATHAAWLLDDGTLVQLATFGEVADVLADVVPALRPIGEDELRSLVAEHPPSTESTLLDQPDAVFEPMGSGEAVASASLTRDGTTYLAEVQEDDRDGFASMLLIGDGGSGGPLRDLQTPTLQAAGHSDGPGGAPLTPVVVSGLLPAGVPDDLAGTRIVDRTTGAELSVIDHVTAAVPGSDLSLALILVDADPGTVRVDITFATADGDRTWRL